MAPHERTHTRTHAHTHTLTHTYKTKHKHSRTHTWDLLELGDLVLPRHHEALSLIHVVVVHQALFRELHVLWGMTQAHIYKVLNASNIT